MLENAGTDGNSTTGTNGEKARKEEYPGQAGYFRTYKELQDKDLQNKPRVGLKWEEVSKPLGLRWEEIGSERPLAGKAIISEPLSKALLEGQNEFTQEQFDAFKVSESDLKEDSYIHVRDSYFKAARAGTDITDVAPALVEAIKKKKYSSGLQWEPIGFTEPCRGQELTNTELAKDLEEKMEWGKTDSGHAKPEKSSTNFTQKEWEKFGINNLRYDTYIKAKNACYFQPAPREFSSDELNFNSALIRELSYDKYIKVDNKYFRPVRGKYSRIGKEGRIPVRLETFLKVGIATQSHMFVQI